MKKIILGFILVCVCVAPAFAKVQGEDIEYLSGGIKLKGYLAYDDSIEGKRPGVIVVHEWWGHNEYARKRARMLAELGYVAFALDMYGDGKVAAHPKEAGEFMNETLSRQGVAQERFLAGLDVLKGFRLTDTEHLAAIGYCFGGATVLNMAMAGVDLAGVVSFHGSLVAPANDVPPGQVKAKILICHGGADSFITPEQITKFKGALDKAQADYQFNVYEGAKHSFTNPEADSYAAKFGMPIGYDAKADQGSWDDMKAFLKSNLGR